MSDKIMKENKQVRVDYQMFRWVFPFKSDCTRVSVSGNVADSIQIKNLKTNPGVK